MKVLTSVSKASDRGFSLIEVLVSAAVLAIVLAVMFMALSTSVSLWRNTDNKIVADREARAIEMLLVRDLANAVMPPATNFWPRIGSVRSGRETASYLKFLTKAPADFQSTAGNELGDICYVEYAVLPSTNGGREVRRLFWPSSRTFREILSTGAFPGVQPAEDFQSLGLYLLPTNSMAARGLGSLASEVSNTNFILIGTNMLPLAAAYTPSARNYPVAVEVNFAVADPETLANSNIIASANYILRNAGLYSFRIPLPKPPLEP
jgi:prepilin-type N-terminal cleavage/methylation domain-containing protein